MSIQSRIVGGARRNEATVTELGQLVTGPLAFSRFYYAATVSNNVPVNVVIPSKRRKFIISSLVISGDRSIAQNGAVTTIYENIVGPTDATISRIIMTEEIAKQTRMTAIGVNLEVTEGVWINVVSDDVIVRVNIAGYFVPSLEDKI